MFRAAMKLDAKEGEQKLEQLARWLERDHPSAAASLREGLSEMFTINRLGLPPRLRKMPGLYQPDRQHPLGCETEDPQGDELEERSDGPQMGGGLVRGDREELPPHHRLRPTLDAQSPPRRPRNQFAQMRKAG